MRFIVCYICTRTDVSNMQDSWVHQMLMGGGKTCVLCSAFERTCFNILLSQTRLYEIALKMR